MANLTWIKGMDSPNRTGRPKGSKRNWKRELERFISRNGTAKELKRLYSHLDTTKEQTEMLRWIYTMITATPQSDSISSEEAGALYGEASEV
jgi:hypothetical protein